MSTAEAAPRLSIVCPWEAEPYQLWSLLDMLDFQAWRFFEISETLTWMRGLAYMSRGLNPKRRA